MSEKDVPTTDDILNPTELEALARDPSADSRKRLLSGLTGRFLADAEASESDSERPNDIFSDVVGLLLEELDAEIRTEFAHSIAPSTEIPHRVVKGLASDEIVVAQLVIELSPVLTDNDLIEIAYQMGPSYRLPMARRSLLGAKLVDTLVADADKDVLIQLADNQGAKFSSSTYRTIVERAKKDEQLQSKLVDRPDFTSTNAIQLAPFLSDELKSRLKLPGADEGGSLLDSLADVESGGSLLDSLADVESESGKSDKSQHPDLAHTIEQINSGELSMNDAVIQCADLGDISPMAALLAGVASLPEKIITTAILNLNGLPLTVMCKGLDLSDEAFGAVLQLRGNLLRLPQIESDKLVKRFSDLPATDAAKTLTVLQSRHAKEVAAA